MSSLIYAGIGSRATPSTVLEQMTVMAAWLARRGLHLHTGGAAGADAAFSAGAPPGRRTLFLPWPGYRGCGGPDCHTLTADEMDRCLAIASALHPAWHRCSHAVRRLHARNAAILLGADTTSPVSAVVCWTVGGAIGGRHRHEHSHRPPARDSGAEPGRPSSPHGLRATRRTPFRHGVGGRRTGDSRSVGEDDMSIFDQGARLVPDIVTEAEERRILMRVADAPWLSDLSRRVQHYGYRYSYTSRNAGRHTPAPAFPRWAIVIADRLRPLFDGVLPEQCIVNEYRSGHRASSSRVWLGACAPSPDARPARLHSLCAARSSP